MKIIPDTGVEINSLAAFLPPVNGNGKSGQQLTPTAASSATDTPADEPPRRFQFLSPSELLNQPPRRWLVYPLIGVGDKGMFFGESGAGKTFAVIELCLCCALGQRFADHFEIDEPIRVAYCAGEGTGGLAERFKAAIASKETDADLLERNLTVCRDVPNLFEPGEGLYHFAADYKATRGDHLDLLVIDTLHSATAGANENSTQDAGKILDSIRFTQQTLGCAVLLVHHANRAGTGERGSSAFRAAMDAVIEISGNRDAAVMKCSKLKDGTPFAPIAFSLVAKGESARVFWHGQVTETAPQAEEREAQAEALAFLRSNPGCKYRASTIGEAIGKSRQNTQQLLAKLHKRGEIWRDTDPGDKKTLLYWYSEGASASGCK